MTEARADSPDANHERHSHLDERVELPSESRARARLPLFPEAVRMRQEDARAAVITGWW
jgi:hypothetical protein